MPRINTNHFFVNSSEHRKRLNAVCEFDSNQYNDVTKITKIYVHGITPRDSINIHMLAQNLTPDFETGFPEWCKVFDQQYNVNRLKTDHFKTPYLEYLVERSSFNNFKEYLTQSEEERNEMAGDGNFSMKSITKIAAGAGEIHSEFAGIAHLHRVGFPYIPYRTIKGAARKYFTENNQGENFKNTCVKDKNNRTIVDLEKVYPDKKGTSLDRHTRIYSDLLFGEDVSEENEKIQNKGFLRLYDAYPAVKMNDGKKLLTIYNDAAHHPKFNNGEEIPLDTDMPTILQSLVVEDNIWFSFFFEIENDLTWIVEHDGGEKTTLPLKGCFKEAELKEWIKWLICKALGQGIGSKTGSSLGYFFENNNAP